MKDYSGFTAFIGLSLGCVIGVAVGGFLAEPQGYAKSEAEWQTRLEDCSKMNGFVYNHQVYQCAATKKWSPNDFKGFM